jgi:hypothetical protein
VSGETNTLQSSLASTLSTASVFLVASSTITLTTSLLIITTTDSPGGQALITLPLEVLTAETAISESRVLLTVHTIFTSQQTAPSTLLPAIDAGGSNIQPANTPSITVLSNGVSATIESKGIVVGSQTLPYPTVPTTMAAGGAEITFDGDPAATAPPNTSVVTPTASISRAPTEGSTASTPTTPTNPSLPGVTASTTTSSSTPSGGLIWDLSAPPSTSVSLTAAPTAYSIFDVTFDGDVYLLPAPGQDPLNFLLKDGSTATLSPSQVVFGGKTFPIPEGLSAPTTLSDSGISIDVSPGALLAPASGADPFGVITDALNGLTGTAKDTASNLDNVATNMVNWAKGGADSLFGGLGDLFKSTEDGLQKIVETIRGIQKEQPIELMNLADDTVPEVIDLQNKAIKTLDLFKSLNRLRLNLPNLSKALISEVQKNALDYTAALGIWSLCFNSLLLFSTTNFATKAKATTNSQPSTTVATSTSSSATPQPTWIYAIVTEEGTPLSKFDDFIKQLDGGVGNVISAHQYPHMTYQLYGTWLNQTQVQQIKSLSWITTVAAEPDPDNGADESYRSLPRIDRNLAQDPFEDGGARLASLTRRAPTTRSNSANHLRQLSDPPPGSGANADYTADDSLGRGQYIYIVDGGFDLTVPVRS